MGLKHEAMKLAPLLQGTVVRGDWLIIPSQSLAKAAQLWAE